MDSRDRLNPFSAAARWVLSSVLFLLVNAGCASRGQVSEPATAAEPPAAKLASAPLPAEADGERPRHIKAVHRSKCGACHTPVSPGSVPRGEAEAAMRRHRHRAKLSDREWNDMVEYISDDGGLRGQPTARLP